MRQKGKRRSAPAPPAPVVATAGPFAAIDMGASAIRLVVAEKLATGELRILEEASRGVPLGKDTFSRGRLSSATMEAALRVFDGFRQIIEGYSVVTYRAVATSAVREAANCDTFLDRIRVRSGLEVEVIDGSEENRLTYIGVRDVLGKHELLERSSALLVEVGGGSADISFLRLGQPAFSGTYALGSIRLRQALASWKGTNERRVRLLARQIHNVVEDIKREIDLREATVFLALGGDVRFAVSEILGSESETMRVRSVPEPGFIAFCDDVCALDVEEIVDRFRLPHGDAETLVPALLVYRDLLLATSAEEMTVPDASLRLGVLVDIVRGAEAPPFEDLRRQVLASAAALGERFRYDAAHGAVVAELSGRLFDELKAVHGLDDQDRLLLTVAALLHDVGIHINSRSHHKHTHYVLSSADIFGLSRDDLTVVANVARYHRRGLPQKSHLNFTALSREDRVRVSKLAALLRVANALDADHLQRIKALKVVREDDEWFIEVPGGTDLTMERLALAARSDLFTEVFGQKINLRETTADA